MTQRKLIIGILTLAIAVGGFWTVTASSIPVQADDQSATDQAKTKDKTAYKAVGKPLVLVQHQWDQERNQDKAVVIESQPAISNDDICGKDQAPDVKTVGYTGYLEDRHITLSKDKENITVDHKRTTKPNQKLPIGYLVSTGFTSKRSDSLEWDQIRITYIGEESNLIVYVRASDNDANNSISDPFNKAWVRLGRADKVVDSTCSKKYLQTIFPSFLGKEDVVRVASYKVNLTAKYLQYMIAVKPGVHVPGLDAHKLPTDTLLATTEEPAKANQPTYVRVPKGQANLAHTVTSPVVGRVAAAVQPVKKIKEDDGKGNGGGDGGSTEGEGAISLKTEILRGTEASSQTETDDSLKSKAPLPTPTPSPTATPQATPRNYCLDKKRKVDPATDVSFGLNQTKGGKTKLEDQQTDSDGEWQGPNQKTEKFPAGRYVIQFADYRKEELRLVALCVEPNNDKTVISSETDPSLGKVTFNVKKDKTVTITALYAPRDMGYLDITKFALPANIDLTKGTKVQKLELVYPGQHFNYMLRWKNNGGETVKSAILQDIIPKPVVISEKNLAQVIKDTKITIEPNANGTLITRRMKDIKPGEKGSITIPVEIPFDAFDKTTTGSNKDFNFDDNDDSDNGEDTFLE